MSNIADLSGAVVIKSDQLNAEDFVGDITKDIVITSVGYFPSDKQQPLHLHSEGLQPFKPCLTMRKALLEIWGTDGRQWTGRTLTLFRRVDVDFGKQKGIGGVRISHLSDMPNPTHKMMLTIRRGLKEEHTFYRWEPKDHTEIINQYLNTPPEQQQALWDSLKPQQHEAIQNSINGAG